jgi:hypothetical protein
MQFLDTNGLAERWKCSKRKIEQQRQSGEGPAYIKIGQQVLYSEEIICAYEADNTFSSTAESDLKQNFHKQLN